MTDLITTAEAAVALGVCSHTIYKMGERDTTFPRAIWVGSRKFYSRAGVQAWLASPDRQIAPDYWRKGEDHQRAKWPKEFVVRARQMFLDGQGYGEIAKALGVSKSWVRDICRGDRRAVDAAAAPEVQE